MQVQMQRAGGAHNLHVTASGRHVGVTRFERLTFGAFDEMDGSEFFETFGEHLGEENRHVLYNHDGHRQAAWNVRKDGGQCVRPAC